MTKVVMMLYALRVLLPAMRAKKTTVSMYTYAAKMTAMKTTVPMYAYAARMTAMKLLQAALIPASLLPILMRTHL